RPFITDECREACGVDARHWRSPGATRLRLGDVLLYFFAFLQSRARQHFSRGYAMVAGRRPPLVVAEPGCQRHALYRRCHPSFARPVGALSAATLSLHGSRGLAACAGFKYSAPALNPFRRCTCQHHVRASVAELCDAAVRLLVREAVHDRGAIHIADGRVDARLYRTLFLAAFEAIFQMGVA